MKKPTTAVPLSHPLVKVLHKHFDAAFYAEEYEDLKLPEKELFGHFVLTGVHEGRSPNKYFDVSEYLAAYRDVLQSGLNPVYHFHTHGKSEGRTASQTMRIKQRLIFLGDEHADQWLRLIRSYIDPDFYKRQVVTVQPYLHDQEIDLAVHYALLGWKLNLDPSPHFSTSQWLENHPELGAFRLNPLLIEINPHLQEPGPVAASASPEPANQPAEEIAPPQPADTTPAPTAADESDQDDYGVDRKVLDAIRTSGLMDADFYLATYSDVRDAGVDPLFHYLHNGWREGRNPSPRFSTAYYLSTYKDAAESGLNPLVHYVKTGRTKGYTTKSPGGWRVEVYENCKAPSIREAGFPSYAGRTIDFDSLKKLLLGVAGKQGTGKQRPLILALSHDSYSVVTGGTQIFIADEMKNARARGMDHLHLTPATPGLTIANRDRTSKVIVTLNGKVLGAAELEDVTRLLGGKGRTDLTVSIHSLMGFGSGMLASLLPIVKANRAYLWLHDYSTLCDGYNLLRNDVTFCGAPAPDSVSCKVCAYGDNRASRLARIGKWVADAKPVVCAPSEAAITVWQGGKATLPMDQAMVVPHWSLTASKPRTRIAQTPLRIAFVGYAVPSKGWPVFDEIANALGASRHVELFHFIKGGKSPNTQVRGIDCTVTPDDRLLTATLLKKHKIDVVMILSPWPETFSFVAAEALMAGCTIACFETSGNVQALVKSTRQGVVFKDAQELMNSISQGTFLPGIKKKLQSAHYHKARQNSGIFDAMDVLADAG